MMTLVATAALGWEPLPLLRAPPRVLRASYAKLLGLACACAGCALLVLHPEASAGPSTNTSEWVAGCGLLLLSASGTAAFALTQKPLLRRFAPLDVLAGAYAIASLIAAAVCAAWTMVGPAQTVSFALQRGEWWALAYTVALVGAGAYSLFTFANSRLPATLVTLYGILQPLLTSLLAFAVLGETPRRASLLGGPLIVLGLVLTTSATAAVEDASREEGAPTMGEPPAASASAPPPTAALTAPLLAPATRASEAPRRVN